MIVYLVASWKIQLNPRDHKCLTYNDMNGPPKSDWTPEIFYPPSELYENSYLYDLNGHPNISAEIIDPNSTCKSYDYTFLSQPH